MHNTSRSENVIKLLFFIVWTATYSTHAFNETQYVKTASSAHLAAVGGGQHGASSRVRCACRCARTTGCVGFTVQFVITVYIRID